MSPSQRRYSWYILVWKICLFLLCVCVCIEHEHVETRGWHWVYCFGFVFLLIYFFERSSVTQPGVHSYGYFGCLTSSWDLVVPASSPYFMLCLQDMWQCPAFLCVLGTQSLGQQTLYTPILPAVTCFCILLQHMRTLQKSTRNSGVRNLFGHVRRSFLIYFI